MAESGCLRDGHFQNLVVTNTTLLDTGDLTISGSTNTVTIPGILKLGTSECASYTPTGLSPVVLTHSVVSRAAGNSGFYPHVIGTVDKKDIEGYDMPACESLFRYLSTKDSLTAVEATHLFGGTAPASQTATLTTAAAGALAGADGFATSVTVQFLTGDFNAARDIGNVNPFADLGDNVRHLIVFGGNSSTSTGAITLSLSGDDKFDDSGCSIAVSGASTQIFTVTGAAGTNNNSFDITLTPTATTKIEKGSFIYLEHTTGNAINCRGYIKVTGGALTPAIPD